MKTAELTKGTYFKTTTSNDVYEVREIEEIAVKCANITTDKYVHLFLNVEVAQVLTDEEKEAVNDFYGI